MTDAVAHRGPDGEGTCVLGSERGYTGFGHRRLAIIDLSAVGRQPMTVRCPVCRVHGLDDLALTFNGEIYNYRELRAELVSRGHVFHSRTDSEVLLHRYAEQGLAMVEGLNGIFAFAIRDGRAAGRPQGMEPGDLLLARDHLGVKPLYHASTPSGFLFASETKAVLQSAEVSRELDPLAVHYHLAYLWCPAPRTALKAVQKLPPGHALLVRAGRVIREWSFYDLPYKGEREPGTEAEIAESLRDAVQQAVTRQLVADVPVGAFLSGGLDSSAVVTMMRRAAPDVVPRCYCIGWANAEDFEGQPSDLPFARQVARSLGVDLQEILVDPGMIRQLERALWFMDEPQADPAPINALLIAERARDEGLKVLLSGAGGDDIFSGYRRHVAVTHEGVWAWLPRGARRGIAATARALASGRGPGGLRAPLLRRLAKGLCYADYPEDRRLVSYFWWSTEELRRGLYGPALAGPLGDADTAEPLLESLARIPHEHDRLNRLLYLEGKHFLADHNLNYTDKMGMAAGVEVRVPLLDVELVRRATRIPPGMKQRGREGKAIFKRSMEGLLPQNVIYRGKTGFGAPLRRWLTVELRELVEDMLAPDVLRRRGLFDPDAVRRLIALDRAGRLDGAYTIFALMCFELWCRQFVDAPAPVEAVIL
jgi:asparagine synthase (glutamine-hydrolysing)